MDDDEIQKMYYKIHDLILENTDNARSFSKLLHMTEALSHNVAKLLISLDRVIDENGMDFCIYEWWKDNMSQTIMKERENFQSNRMIFDFIEEFINQGQ